MEVTKFVAIARLSMSSEKSCFMEKFNDCHKLLRSFASPFFMAPFMSIYIQNKIP